ncbi:hypothetical protein [Haloprofundus salilacus]|uniref:hypothetical protein n=1 Tax=Haloprofundus salilacus TaxID=2876190 RepID=UPI001CCB5A0B|nr:hypothetical protein [Haloprofundus salilacus]
MLSQSGNELGTAERVENGDPYVEIEPDADPNILDELNWDGTVSQEVHRLGTATSATSPKERFVSGSNSVSWDSEGERPPSGSPDHTYTRLGVVPSHAMSTDLIDDEGKPLLDGTGEHVGFVADVEDGTAYVEPDRDIDDESKRRLGWGPSKAETYPLRCDAIDSVTDEKIRLHADYGGE